ncbi:MAG: hypothetical protein KatS3mg023_1954 [Armatimonadota bacterium]|nr:MAG: hypothetical protein KatS3mg023_1954 [Armatimonadota bacterium]
MSEHEVVQAIGPPDAVYEPSQEKEVYRTYVTKPLIPSKGQMWTYDIWMYRLVVHFGKDHRVAYVVLTYT